MYNTLLSTILYWLDECYCLCSILAGLDTWPQKEQANTGLSLSFAPLQIRHLRLRLRIHKQTRILRHRVLHLLDGIVSVQPGLNLRTRPASSCQTNLQEGTWFEESLTIDSGKPL